MSVEVKSTGTLIDEYITAGFKVEVKPTPENIKRMQVLSGAIFNRIGYGYEIQNLVEQLRIVLRECWNAQEIVMEGKNLVDAPYVSDTVWMRIAKAGITAQKTNAERNALIRKIDELLGEKDTTALEKTY